MRKLLLIIFLLTTISLNAQNLGDVNQWTGTRGAFLPLQKKNFNRGIDADSNHIWAGNMTWRHKNTLGGGTGTSFKIRADGNAYRQDSITLMNTNNTILTQSNDTIKIDVNGNSIPWLVSGGVIREVDTTLPVAIGKPTVESGFAAEIDGDLKVGHGAATGGSIQLKNTGQNTNAPGLFFWGPSAQWFKVHNNDNGRLAFISDFGTSTLMTMNRTGGMFLGTTNTAALSGLDVATNVAIGSYAGSTAAPAAGLAVSGKSMLGGGPGTLVTSPIAAVHCYTNNSNQPKFEIQQNTYVHTDQRYGVDYTIHMAEIQTTTATTSTLYSYPMNGGNDTVTVQLEMTVIMKQTAAGVGNIGDGASFDFIGTYKRIGLTLSQIGSIDTVHIARDQAGLQATFSPNDTTDKVDILITSTAATQYWILILKAYKMIHT